MRLETKRQAVDALLTEAIAVAVSLFIYLCSSAQGYAELLLLIAASTLSEAGIRAMLGINRRNSNEKVSREAHAAWLYSTLYSHRSGIPYEKAMFLSGKRIDYAPLKESVMRALRHRTMHAGAQSGIVGNSRWALGELRKGFRKKEATRADAEESTQRYATFNMFVSTVVPSFMIFAFIGSSILSRSSFSVAAFASVLLLGVPLLYSLGSMLMWRRLLA